MRNLLQLLFLGLMLVQDMPAQPCLNVVFSQYGSSCGSIFPSSNLTGHYAPGACLASLTFAALPGCCNSFQVNNFWAIGFQSTQIPISGMPQPCLLLNSMDALIITPAILNILNIPVTSQLLGLTIYVQAARSYFTTIGFTTGFTFSNGLMVSFQ